MAIDVNNLGATATLTFSDEFSSLNLWNGTSGTWRTNYNFGSGDIASLSGNGEAQWYINAQDPNTAALDPWTISGGVLSLTAAPTPEAMKPYVGDYSYTSGLLTTQTSFAQQYGYFEISAKLPAGQGLWPAFWMLPTDNDWRPELDILEVIGNDTTSLWNFVHPADPSEDRYFNTVVPDMSAGFHRFGSLWTPETITFYFDGKVTGVAPTPTDMHQPMYMLLNLAVGGSWAGPPNASTQFPASYQIDYVRVYSDASMSPTLSISASASGFEGNSGSTDFVYTVTRAGNASAGATVAWSVTGTGGNAASAADFLGGTLPGGTLTFAPGQTSATITVKVAGETVSESDETFAVNLSNATGAGIAQGTATGLIRNDDTPQPTTAALSPGTITLAEGASGQTWFIYNVSRSGDINGPSVIDWAVTGSGANPANAADFGGVLPSGRLYYGGGEATKQVFIAVTGDTVVEPTETFTVTLVSATGATITTGTAQGVITNDDGGAPTQPSLSIGPATVTLNEGASGSTAFAFTVTRTGDLTAASSANWSVAGSGANAASAGDFTGGSLPSGTVSFAAGQSTATVTVNVAGDTAVEQTEGFTVTLAGPTNAVLGTASAQGVITNDDSAAPAQPSLSIGPATITQNEGASGSTAFAFTVTRTGDLSAASSANWSVTGSGVNAASAGDFTGGSMPSGTVSFAAGQSTATVTVNVAGDTTPEPTESFTVTLAGPTNAVLGTASAQGLITNDDAAPPPSLSIGPATVTQNEGASGSTAFAFTVSRTGDLTAASSANWAVTGSGAAAASAGDFIGGSMPSGTVSFAAGQSTATVTVNVAGDTTVEQTEGFTVTLASPTNAVLGTASAQGVITNDDSVAPTQPSLSIGPATITQNEGASGSTAFAFTVTRTGDLTGASSANWSVVGSGAAAASAGDFIGGSMPSGTVSFAAGQSTATVTVNVAGDTTVEQTEGFTVNLAGPTNAVLGTASAQGVITDDDAAPQPSLSIGPATVTQNEGASGSTAFAFTVTRTGDLTATSAANWSVTGSGANAASAGDFTGGSMPSGTVSFAAGQSTATVTVNVAGDATVEQTEGFTVTLAGPTNAVLGTASAQGVITNDDSAAPAQPSLSIGPATVTLNEGASGSTAFAFTVTRTGDLTAASSANWSVAGSGANAASAGDFTGGSLPSGTVSFAAGQSTATVTVNVAGDTAVEQTEGFTVTLASPTNAVLGTASAQGVITNDDSAAPAPGGTGTSGDDVFVLSPTSNLTITGYDQAGQDALGIPTGAGGFSLAGYSGQATLTIFEAAAWWNTANGGQVLRWTGDPAIDTAAEVDALLESMPGNGGGGLLFLADGPGNVVSVFYDPNPAQRTGVQLVATINGMASPASLVVADFKPSSGAAAPAQPSLSIGPATVTLNEGASGSTAFAFTVTRTGDLTAASSANWSVAGSGANAASAGDFTGGSLPSGTVSFAAGQSTATVTVNVAGDTAVEQTEGFTVTLASPTNAVLGTASAQGVITNDDSAPASGTSLSISPTSSSIQEGTGWQPYMVFDVVRTGDLGGPTVASWQVAGSGTNAASANDFGGGVFPGGQVFFGGGESVKSIWLPIAGDSVYEQDESFTVTLYGATGGAIVLTGVATGMIQNDDIF